MKRAVVIQEMDDIPLVYVAYFKYDYHIQRMPYESLPDARISFTHKLRIATLSRCLGITEAELSLNIKAYEGDDEMIPTELCTTKAYGKYMKDKCMPKSNYTGIYKGVVLK